MQEGDSAYVGNSGFDSPIRSGGEGEGRDEEEDGELDLRFLDDDDEIPDEFLCALTYEVMQDPVRLPSGFSVSISYFLRIGWITNILSFFYVDDVNTGSVTERSVIETHLLSDERDPFTMGAMTIGDLEDLPELKFLPLFSPSL